MKLRTLLILGTVLMLCGTASAQRVSLKTNALYWATSTPNLAVEIGLGSRTTLEIGGGYNPSGSETGKSSQHWLVQPELRWWFNRRFAGTFVGLHLHAGDFNLAGISPFTKLKNGRYDGNLMGAGIGIGRHWLLSSRWGIEMQAGFGFVQMEYDKYDCFDCENPVGNKFKNTYIGPTRLNFSLIYYLR